MDLPLHLANFNTTFKSHPPIFVKIDRVIFTFYAIFCVFRFLKLEIYADKQKFSLRVK